MESVAAGNEVALNFIDSAVFYNAYGRTRAIDAGEGHLSAFEAKVAAISESPGDQILDNLLLPINGDALARELCERYVMADAVESKINPFVAQAFPVESICDTSVP